MPRRTSGWKNTYATSDPELRRTLDSISDWSHKLGAGCRVFKSTDQTIATGIGFPTQVLFDQAMYDPWNFFDATNSRLVVPQGLDGMYVGYAQVTWDAGSPGGHRRSIAVGNNALGGVGGFTYGIQDTDWGNTAGVLAWNQSLTTAFGPFPFRAGDLVYCAVHQTSGVNLDILAYGGTAVYMSFARIGDYREWAGH